MSPHYPADSVLVVKDFDYTVEGDEVTVGDQSRQVFLTFPLAGLKLLESLRAGLTVEQAAMLFEREHGEPPDIDSFVGVLESEGFVERRRPDGRAGPERTDNEPGRSRRAKWFGFDWLSPEVARRLISARVTSGCALLVIGAMALLVADPDLIPPTSVLIYEPRYFAVQALSTTVLALMAVALHELAHAMVARANNVPVTLSIGHLIYQPVAQTDISGIWLAPRRARYIAFLAGTVVDLTVTSLLLMFLWAEKHGNIGVPAPVLTVLQAWLLTYFFRMSFQLLFYMRTDLYYVFVVATRCKDLMADAEQFLRDSSLRLLGLQRYIDPRQDLPAGEARLVRGYAVLWVAGRIFALAVLFAFYLPLMVGYAASLFSTIASGDRGLGLLNLAVAALIVYVVEGLGIVLWLRTLGGLWKRRIESVRTRRAQWRSA